MISIAESAKIIRESVRCTLHAFRQRLNQWYKPIILDVLFLFCAGFVLEAMGKKAVEALTVLGSGVVQKSSAFEQGGTVWDLIGQEPALKSAAFQGIILLVAAFVSLYILYGVFQGILWGFLLSLKRPEDKKIYLVRFFKVNLAWWACFLLILIGSYVVSLRDRLAKNISAEFAGPNLDWLFLLIVVILLYCSSFSYVSIKDLSALQSLKLSLKALRQIPLLVGLPIIMGSVLYLLGFVLDFVALSSERASLVVGIVVLFPLLIIIRLFIIEVMQRVPQ